MSFFSQVFINSLATGSIFGLIAVGYSLTFMTTKTLNFGLGMWVMAGGMLTYYCTAILSIPALLVAPIVILFLLFLGFFAEKLTVKPFTKKGNELWIMSTLAVGLLFIDLSEIIWGRNLNRVPPYFGDTPISIGNTTIRPQYLLTILTTVTIYLLLDHFYRKTLYGKVFRAVAHDKEMCSLLGINVRAVESWSYALAAALAALAGFLIVPITGADSHFGTGLGFKAFAVAIIAGLDSPRGILACGLLYGVFEGLVSAYFFTGIRDILGFTLVIVALFFWPNGLFGHRKES